jgi:hypothetical protein
MKEFPSTPSPYHTCQVLTHTFRATFAVDASGCAKITRISHGDVHRMMQTPATVAGLEYHAQPAIGVTMTTRRRCPKATGLSSIGRAGDTDER